MKTFRVLACFLAMALPPIAFGQEDEGGSDVAKEMKRIAALGPGVHEVQKDKKGQITSCIIVGQARISTALGKAKGIELARDKANLDCSAQFVKWLKEEVSVYQSNEDEAIILMEGSEEKENDSLKESAKSVEKSSKKMESVAKGAVRGLQMLHKETDGDGKTYTVVKGFKASNLDALKKLSDDLKSDEPSSKKNGGSESGSAESKKKKNDKEIESDSSTAGDAGDFLPKRKKQ
jgi:hypothetical protein